MFIIVAQYLDGLDYPFNQTKNLGIAKSKESAKEFVKNSDLRQVLFGNQFIPNDIKFDAERSEFNFTDRFGEECIIEIIIEEVKEI